MRKKFRKILKISAIILGGVVIIDAALVFGFAVASPQVKPADAIIIMGAAINTPSLYNRTLEGLDLYKKKQAPVMVLSGGRISQRYISEAGYMLRVIDQKTSAPVNVILDEDAGSTYENIKNARRLVPEAKSLIVVSDKFHLARSVIMAKALGFDKVYFSGPDQSYYKFSELSFYYLREMAAMISYVPKFIWK